MIKKNVDRKKVKEKKINKKDKDKNRKDWETERDWKKTGRDEMRWRTIKDARRSRQLKMIRNRKKN